MCSRQAVTGCFTYPAASREELVAVALDGISRSVSRFCNPRTSSRAVFRHRNAGPKMVPFSEPSVLVPILESSRNGPGFRDHFWSRFSPFLNAGFRKKWLQAGVAVTVTIFHSFFLVFLSQHDNLSCCRIRDNDSNNLVQLCN